MSYEQTCLSAGRFWAAFALNFAAATMLAVGGYLGGRELSQQSVIVAILWLLLAVPAGFLCVLANRVAPFRLTGSWVKDAINSAWSTGVITAAGLGGAAVTHIKQLAKLDELADANPGAALAFAGQISDHFWETWGMILRTASALVLLGTWPALRTNPVPTAST
ncbi:MAG: hypothetical protein LBE25_07955 [Arthrobacter sp.]|nr:hypothetical protein [Arthrobacter sp.]